MMARGYHPRRLALQFYAAAPHPEDPMQWTIKAHYSNEASELLDELIYPTWAEADKASEKLTRYALGPNESGSARRNRI